MSQGPSPHVIGPGENTSAAAREVGASLIARVERSDRCPAVTRPFVADDGAMIRLRIPGGRVAVQILSALLDIATDHGAPVLQLTSRANLQLRALPDPLPHDLIAAVEATGLLPSRTHELSRNILASTGEGRIADLVRALDQALMADVGLADLPGRFLFAIGSAGDAILGEPWDLAYEFLDDRRGRVLAGSQRLDVPPAGAVAELSARAAVFVRDRAHAGVWNVRDLPGDSAVFAGMSPHTVHAAEPPRPGVVGDGLIVGVPLGLLREPQLAALARVTDAVTVTPWRSLVIPGGARHAAVLAAAGLITSADSPWTRLSACVGAPSCRRTSSPTLDLALAAVATLSPSGPRVHLAGCERRCGHPAGEHVTVLAPTSVGDIVTAAGAHP